MGTFDGDELYDGSTARLSLEIKPYSSPKISAFKEFKAFDSFKNGFEDYKEQPQIRSSIWLLSILDANPIALGILDKNRDGEQITENGVRLNFSADIIADFDDVPLVIDCTTGVPETQKIDKIYNTARYLTKKTSKTFLPIIISNQSAKGMKQEAIKNSVLLLDRDDISEITDKVLDNAVNDAKQIFLDKLKEVL